jgi:hypothetical protein
MVATNSTVVRGVGLVAVIASLIVPVSPARAFSLEDQLMCSGDAYRLCSSEIPDIEKITVCMRQQRDKLSNGCRAVMERDEAAALRESNARLREPPKGELKR